MSGNWGEVVSDITDASKKLFDEFGLSRKHKKVDQV